MRVCVAYDCLFPWTVGGAERWYRNLAERLAQDGHEVTYITRRQWQDAALAGPGVQAHARADDHDLHAGDPRRVGAVPLAQRQVGDVVALGREALGEVAVPALGAADRVGEEAVVDEADPHGRVPAPE